MVMCNCGTQASICMSWTNQNPGRRFSRCSHCGFVGWPGHLMCRLSMMIIPGLLLAGRKMLEEISRLEADLEDAMRYKIPLMVWCALFVVFALFTMFG